MVFAQSRGFNRDSRAPSGIHATGLQTWNRSASDDGLRLRLREKARVSLTLPDCVIGTVSGVGDLENIIGFELALDGETPEMRSRILCVCWRIHEGSQWIQRGHSGLLRSERWKQIDRLRLVGI